MELEHENQNTYNETFFTRLTRYLFHINVLQENKLFM
jgi:hypothetical protein